MAKVQMDVMGIVNVLVPKLLDVIAESGVSAGDATMIPDYLAKAIEFCNAKLLNDEPFRP